MDPPERACTPTRSSKPHLRAPPPGPRLKTGARVRHFRGCNKVSGRLRGGLPQVTPVLIFPFGGSKILIDQRRSMFSHGAQHCRAQENVQKMVSQNKRSHVPSQFFSACTVQILKSQYNCRAVRLQLHPRLRLLTTRS